MALSRLYQRQFFRLKQHVSSFFRFFLLCVCLCMGIVGMFSVFLAFLVLSLLGSEPSAVELLCTETCSNSEPQRRQLEAWAQPQARPASPLGPQPGHGPRAPSSAPLAPARSPALAAAPNSMCCPFGTGSRLPEPYPTLHIQLFISNSSASTPKTCRS